MGETTRQAERHEFGAEVGRLLDLVVHSLYSEREIFLRELVANAADAIDRRRFEALTHPALALPEGARVRIEPDQGGRTLTISDDGIGMTREELVANLGTIARSGTRAFGETLEQAKPEERPSLIGQFGVGFYSAFMVADRVAVTSRRAGSEEGWTWDSDGRGGFSIAPASRATPGTDVVLSMKSDAAEYLDAYRVETVVRKWADHVTVPVMVVRDGKELPASEGTALWRKPKSEISEQSYTEFYRHLGAVFDKPWTTLHWRTEGALEFYALLFIPSAKPFEPLEQERQSRVHLHVRRMFITDQAELLPPWLRFVKGVVDTEDLPLNVSREMLQATPVLARMRKALTNRVLTELKTRSQDAESYATFWQNFGTVLKEGVYDDPDHRNEIAALLRMHSSTVEGLTSLADYVARMPAEQAAVYVLAGDSVETLRHSAQLEGFRRAGHRSAAARRSDRRVLAGAADRVFGQAGAECGEVGCRSRKTAAQGCRKCGAGARCRGACAGAAGCAGRCGLGGAHDRATGDECGGPGGRGECTRSAHAAPAAPRRARRPGGAAGPGDQRAPCADRRAGGTPRGRRRSRRGRRARCSILPACRTETCRAIRRRLRAVSRRFSPKRCAEQAGRVRESGRSLTHATLARPVEAHHFFCNGRPTLVSRALVAQRGRCWTWHCRVIRRTDRQSLYTRFAPARAEPFSPRCRRRRRTGRATAASPARPGSLRCCPVRKALPAPC